MEGPKRHLNLLSEKQAAKRLGVARITLLRARAAGRIRFFRIGTRVLYGAEQLNEFLQSCERNGRRRHDREQPAAERIDARGKNTESAPRRRSAVGNKRASVDGTQPAKTDQAPLLFSAIR